MPPEAPKSSAPWWDRAVHARRRPFLTARAAIRAAVAGYFAGDGFAEVETPILQHSPGMEVHLRAFRTSLHEPFEDAARDMYLHTSPEFAMKKLLAAGEEKIFQFARCFRDGERGDTHHPEFTMLEWYRAGAGIDALVTDCAALLRAARDAVPAGMRGAGLAWPGLVWRGRACDPNRPPEILTVAEAFARHAGIDILATAPDPERPDADALRQAARAAGINLPDSGDWEDLFFHIFLARIEPHLGVGAPTVLCDYPVSMAALARRSPTDARVSLRFELYVCGLELANGFDELTDAAEQRARFEADQARREALYGNRLPIDDDFLDAVAAMPPAAGIALGFDRLVMLATGATTIDDVLWAPVA